MWARNLGTTYAHFPTLEFTHSRCDRGTTPFSRIS